MNIHEAISVEVGDEGAVDVRPAQPNEDLSPVELLPLQGMLNMYEPSPTERSQMKEVWEYFAKDSQGTGDALHKLKQVELRMREPRLGETRLGKLYNYVKLKSQTADLESQLESL